MASQVFPRPSAEPGRYGLPGNPKKRYHFPVHPTGGVLFWEYSVLHFGGKEVRKGLDAHEPLGRRNQGKGSDGKEFC